mmetsp:Transcript_17901/g.28971  ORF Transcript_17901/g.28971 Transcript_17901/m.28971 type:complete len:171 (-) Transcript_17901:993-1505(-)
MLAQPNITIVTVLLLSYVSETHCFDLPRTAKVQQLSIGHYHSDTDDATLVVAAPSPPSSSDPSLSRKSLLDKTKRSAAALAFLTEAFALPAPAHAKCTDIESCREEGERKVEAELKRNPIVRLSDGVRYRVLRPPASPSSSEKVAEGSSIDLIYSITTASGQYMYSRGFG